MATWPTKIRDCSARLTLRLRRARRIASPKGEHRRPPAFFVASRAERFCPGCLVGCCIDRPVRFCLDGYGQVDFNAKRSKSWAILNQLGVNLDPTWSQHGPTWGQLGANLGPTWGQLGATWGPLEPTYSSLNQHLPSKVIFEGPPTQNGHFSTKMHASVDASPRRHA